MPTSPDPPIENQSFPALDIRVINLDRSKSRMATFEKLNGRFNLQVSRFSAIEGKTVAQSTLVERGIITADLGYGDGALGCALSHIALWDLAIEKNQPLMVCEDDAIFNHGFRHAASSVVKSLPPDWHMILWGWNFDSILLFDMLPGVSPCLGAFDQDRMRMGVDAFQSANVTPQAFRLYKAFGALAYSLSPNGARTLRQHCLPLRRMEVFIPGLGRAVSNTGIDVALNDVYPKIKAYVCFPSLVISRNLHSVSTIQESV